MPDKQWKPWRGLELVFADGRRTRVDRVEFVDDDDPNAEPRRWRLTALSVNNVRSLAAIGYVEQVS